MLADKDRIFTNLYGQGDWRLAGARAPDKFERESAAFFTRVRDEYLRRAKAAPERFVVIDAAQSIEAIAGQLAGVFARLGVPGHGPR